MMIRGVKILLAAMLSVFAVNMYIQTKVIWSQTTDVRKRQLVNLEDFMDSDISHEYFMGLPNEPNITLLTSLFDLKNPGVNGTPMKIDLRLLPEEEKIKIERNSHRHATSYVSSIIPLQRPLPDIRFRNCEKVYSELPMVSVVIVFHNEHWSTLLRTVHSVVDYSPYHMIDEIILVDDYSSDEVLKEPLDDYMARKFDKVRVEHTSRRRGVAEARNMGFVETTAPIVVFLDPQCECFTGWLEPLVARIAGDNTIVTTSVIHQINPLTFGIDIQSKLHLHVLSLPGLRVRKRYLSGSDIKNRKRLTDPYPSPAMEGYVIAVSRKWFQTLEMFDPDLFGGENLELSLKTWMCGGRLEIMPCSHVAHVQSSRPENDTSVINNIARVAKVWTNEKTYRRGVLNHYQGITDIQEVTKRSKIRQKLKCRSFGWYMRTINKY